jgi:hypothetical protein
MTVVRRLRHSILVQRLLRQRRQALNLTLLTGLSLALIMYAYVERSSPFLSEVSLSLGTNLVIVIATYLIFNPLIEHIRTATTHEHPKLDYDAFIENIARSQQIVCILTTWTRLLEEPYRMAFLAALRDALHRGVRVQILLLDPTSVAAELRSEELQRREYVPRLIMANLRCLQRFLSEEDVPKLETFVTSVWADFVRGRFEELWNDTNTMTLRRHLLLPLVVLDRAGSATEIEVNYVLVEDTYYVENSLLTQFVARHGIGTVTAHVKDLPESTSPPEYSLTLLDDWPGVTQAVARSLTSKYEDNETRLVFCLSQSSAQTTGRDGSGPRPPAASGTA